MTFVWGLLVGHALRDVLRAVVWLVGLLLAWRRRRSLDTLVSAVRADAWTRHEDLEADRAALSTLRVHQFDEDRQRGQDPKAEGQ